MGILLWLGHLEKTASNYPVDGKIRWQIHVRPHMSVERVSATCEVFLMIAWFFQNHPWV
ncbi:hypothetical protein [Streptomyces prunicolor]|uniref:hypothetical protein n=1 Tax=Streptomyces prunicolor TaxID=67348 RepID=UPI0033CCF1F4